MGSHRQLDLHFENVCPSNFTDMMTLLKEQAAHHNTQYAGDDKRLFKEISKKQPIVKGILAREFNQSAPAGMILYHHFGNVKGPTLYIEDIVTAKAARGQGVGAKMMENFTQTARQCGASAIEWLVSASNPSAIGFYENKVHASRLHLMEYDAHRYLEERRATPENVERLTGRGITRLQKESPSMPLMPQKALENIQHSRLRNHNLEVFLARDEMHTPLALAVANKNFSTFRTCYGYEVEFIDLSGSNEVRKHAYNNLMTGVADYANKSGANGHLYLLTDSKSSAQMEFTERESLPTYKGDTQGVYIYRLDVLG